MRPLEANAKLTLADHCGWLAAESDRLHDDAVALSALAAELGALAAAMHDESVAVSAFLANPSQELEPTTVPELTLEHQQIVEARTRILEEAPALRAVGLADFADRLTQIVGEPPA